jgi:hypothetical protein
MEDAKDIEDKADAQADLNKELEKTAKIQKSMGMEEDATPKGEDFFYDYLDIGMSYLEGFGKKHSLDDSQLEKLGKKIVDQLYKGDIGKAYDAIVKRGAMNEEDEAPAGDKELQKKASKQDKVIQKYQNYRKELKSYLKDYQKAKDDSAKEKALQQMKKISQSAEYVDAKEKYDRLAKVN